MIDCSKTEIFLAEWKRLCDSRKSCLIEHGDKNYCPLIVEGNGKNKEIYCEEFVRLYPSESIKRLQKWSDETKQRKQVETMYLCMPLVNNIPVPRNKNWKLTTCDICGRECWETEEARSMLKCKNIVKSCTMCALKAI